MKILDSVLFKGFLKACGYIPMIIGGCIILVNILYGDLLSAFVIGLIFGGIWGIEHHYNKMINKSNEQFWILAEHAQKTSELNKQLLGDIKLIIAENKELIKRIKELEQD